MPRKRLVFDIETNGLLDVVDRVHSLCIGDLDTGEIFSFTDAAPTYMPIACGLDMLRNAERLYGHNIEGFDLPALRKVYPTWTTNAEMRDTLIVSRLVYAHRKELDFDLWRQGKLPGKLIGSHSLEAWGYRLGNYKGDFKGPWEVWTREMQDYCEQDVRVTARLVKLLASKQPDPRAVQVEHELQRYLNQQRDNGFPFDQDAAGALWVTLDARARELEGVFAERFGSWEIKLPDFIPKRDNAKKGYKKGVPVPRSKTVTFKPTSRDHIAHVLQTQFGWQPTEFTTTGKPQVSDDTLESLDIEEAKLLAEYLLIEKRIGQIQGGKEAWLKWARWNPKGFAAIHGEVMSIGAVTHRAAHKKPNLAQVPKVGSPYGKECRGFFFAPPGWSLVGADMSGLELRCLAHYMAKYDGGAYGKIILEGDIHAANRDALGLDGKPGREKAKTFIYAYLYGAGDQKLGSILEPLADANVQKMLGGDLRRTFERNIPALGELAKAVKRAARKLGYVTLPDGRKAHIRSDHAALNTLLQGAGAVLCKWWVRDFGVRMTNALGPQGWDGRWAANAWVHDEIQFSVKAALAQESADLAVACTRVQTERFNWRVPLDGEAKIGQTWADTH